MKSKIGYCELKETLKRFFMGPLYPILVGGIILFSHLFGIEFYLNFLNVFLCILSFLVCDSARPFIPVLCTYVYQFSRLTNISDPSKSDFYYAGARLYIIILLFVLAILSSVYFFIKHGKRSLEALKDLPILPSAVILTAAFLMNGAFCETWSPFTLGFGAVQMITFFVILYFFTVGLRDEKGEELASYFAYVTAIMAVILIIETGYLYLSKEELFLDGSVVKENIQYGWGMWNTAGQQMVMILPMLFYGVMKNKHPWVYYVLAGLTVLCAALTLSRNALLLSAAVFLALSVACCFVGQLKEKFRIILPILVGCFIIAVILFWGRISAILADYLERGLSDNGRFELWGKGFSAFLEAPVFGKGFFGVFPPEMQDGGIFPTMVHNTLIELLAAMGIFGFGAYVFYRIQSLKPFVIRPTLVKTMLGLSMFTVIVGSLLDNFLFYYHQMLYYPVAQAIAFKIFSEQDETPLSA